LNVEFMKKLIVGSLMLLGVLLVITGLSFDAPGADEMLLLMGGLAVGMIVLGLMLMTRALNKTTVPPAPTSPISDEMVSAMFLAREETEASGQASITDLHLLRGLLRTRGSAAEVALSRVGVDLDQLPDPVPQPAGSAGDGGSGQVPLSVTAQVCLQVAREEAQFRGDRQVGTGHVLLALLRPEVSMVAPLLQQVGLEREQVLAIMVKVD
jgi:hypothetical protein